MSTINIDINTLSKKFVENVIIGMGKEHFFLGLMTGNDVQGYVLTPSQMKVTFSQMKEQIEKFEKAFHKIDDPSSSGIPSELLLGDDMPKPSGPDKRKE